jgi:hypothetical protein
MFKQYRTKSPQLAAWIRTQLPGISCEILPLVNNPTKTEFIFTPADDQLYRAVAAFNSNGAVSIQDFLHELNLIRDGIRSTLRSGGMR